MANDSYIVAILYGLLCIAKMQLYWTILHNCVIFIDHSKCTFSFDLYLPTRFGWAGDEDYNNLRRFCYALGSHNHLSQVMGGIWEVHGCTQISFGQVHNSQFVHVIHTLGTRLALIDNVP